MLSGRNPDSTLARDGMQMENWQYARWNSSPSAASRSRLGDLTVAFP